MSYDIVVVEDSIDIVEVLIPGPQGPSGPVRVTRTAGMALSGHRVVRLNAAGEAIYANSSIIEDASVVLGITINAADLGDTILIQTEGELIESSWNWSQDLPIFLSTNGQLTQIEPLAGFTIQVAIPTGADRIFIRIGEPILR